MFTKVLDITLVIFIFWFATSVRSSIIGCDPFPATTGANGMTQHYFVREFRATCPDSIIDWTTGEEALEISASMDNCASVSSASVHFSYKHSYTPFNQYSIKIVPSEQYLFSYSIKWREKNTFCVVDLTRSQVGASEIVSIDMVDQKGLSNKPNEDLSAFASGNWYTRSFSIDGSVINNANDSNVTFLRFGFSCFGNTSDPATQVQKAYVDNIIFQRVGDQSFRTLYSHNQNCTQCSSAAPAILEAYCNATTMAWQIDGPLNVSKVNFEDYVIIQGDLFTDEIVLNYYTMQVTGCIYPRVPRGIINITSLPNILYPTTYSIYIGFECNIDSWNIPYTHYFYSGAVHIEVGPSYPPSSYCDECNPGDFSAGAVTLTLWIVLPVACTVGLVVGLVVGIRKYRANKRAQNLDAEMANRAS